MVKLSVVQLTYNDKDLWNDCVYTNPDARVFHLWEWGDALCKTYMYQRYYLAVRCEEDIVGILPLILIRGGIFADKLISLPFCEYGGPLLTDSLERSTAKHVLTLLLKGLINLMRGFRVDYIELRHPPMLLSPFLSSFGFAASQRYLTFRIDLTKSESELWQNLKRDVRRRVKKAMESGIKIKSVNTDYVKEYYDIYLRTQKEHGSPPHSYNFLMNICSVFKPKGLMQILLAVYDGKPIAGDIFFCFNGKMNTWSGVIDARYRNLYPTHLLFWHMIKWGSEKGFKFFDLGRTRSETKGIYYFKSRWGGGEMNLEDYFFMEGPLEIPDPLQSKYVYLSRMWSLLPSALTRQIGPKIISRIGL